MTITFEYSLRTDFTSGLNVKELYREILESSDIISKCITVKNDNHGDSDLVEIIFERGLTRGEKLTLDHIVKSHTPLNIPELTNMIVKNIDRITYSEHYERMNKFIFPGAEFCHIKVGGHMDREAISWSIMIYDYDNHCKIVESTFYNTEHQIFDLGLGEHIPQDEVTFEIFAKVEGVTEDDSIGGHIDSIKLQFA